MIVSIYIYKYLPEFMLRMVAVIITKMIYKIKVKNMIKFQHDKAYIITSNHISFVDWLIISSVVNKPVVFVMHYSFYNIPIIKYLLKDAKVIPIASEKENAKILEKSFLSINESLKNNEILCIFPEGKISYDGQLNSFKQGITKIAMNNPDVDIVPLAIKGMYGSSFSRKDKSITKRILSLLKNYNRNIELVCSNETLKYEENIHIKIQEITNNMLK